MDSCHGFLFKESPYPLQYSSDFIQQLLVLNYGKKCTLMEKNLKLDPMLNWTLYHQMPEDQINHFIFD